MPSADLDLPFTLLAACALVVIGLAGMLLRRSLLVTVMGVELCLLGAALAFSAYAIARGDPVGLAAGVVILLVGAVWAVIGSALALTLFRRRGTVNIDELRELRG
jgi:NADH-quinone oxidoreductase subunit K